MRECDRHTSESQPGGGVCARCLAERLTWLWRGESFRHADTVPRTSSATTTSMAVENSAQPKRLPDASATHPGLAESPDPSIAALSLASVRQQLQVLGVARQPPTAVAAAAARSRVVVQDENPSGDAANPVAMAAEPTTSKPQNSTSIIEEWTAFHAQRRGNAEPELALLESPKAKSSKSFDSMESPKAKSSKSFDSMESPKAKSSKSFDSMESPKAKSSKSFDSMESPKAKSSKSFDSMESPKAKSSKSFDSMESPKAKSSKSFDSMESPKAKSSKSFDSMESPKAKSSKSFDSMESPKAKSSKSFDSMESPKAKSSKSFDSIESLSENGATRPVVQPSPELRTLMNAQKMRSQSLPLNFRSAEETAARVINEQADDYLDEELEMYEVRDGDGGGGGGEPAMVQEHHDVPGPRCFSPVWRSPKWVKALASPLSSRNRVFPSRSKDTDVRKRSRSKRGARLDSSDWGFKDANGGSSPLWRSRAQGTLQRSSSRTRSMFSWLQDAETKQDKKHDQAEQQLTSSSSSSLSTDSWLRDLTTVGHLHEIAEELEIVEESSEEEDEREEEESELEDLGDVSSFGKFLLQAAQRHPNPRLTRLVSVSSSQRL